MEDVDLAFWRSREDIQNDKTMFPDDGEWELLSVPSHHRVVHVESGRFAQIQFNVGIRYFSFASNPRMSFCLASSTCLPFILFLSGMSVVEREKAEYYSVKCFSSSTEEEVDKRDTTSWMLGPSLVGYHLVQPNRQGARKSTPQSESALAFSQALCPSGREAGWENAKTEKRCSLKRGALTWP